MSSKTKSVTAVLIVLALVAGVGMTKAGSKYKTQEKVNLIFANVTSNSAKKAGEKFKELVEEYSDGDITVDLFQDNQLGDDKTAAEGVQNGVLCKTSVSGKNAWRPERTSGRTGTETLFYEKPVWTDRKTSCRQTEKIITKELKNGKERSVQDGKSKYTLCSGI